MTDSTQRRNAPCGRSHTPVLTVDYQSWDAKAGYGDAHFLDIGQSTWNKEDFSAKIWRWSDACQRWSRQGEELPLSRVLDLAILVAAQATGRQSRLQEFVQGTEQVPALYSFLTENMQVLEPKLNELRRILQGAPSSCKATGMPNLFDFATSELSQDAVFSWLLSWADPKCESYDACLHSVAVDFLGLLTGNPELNIEKITVGRQWEHIDVWAEINDDVFLAIEDKTMTTVHDNQLKRYREIVESEYPNHKKYYAYVKTGNEPQIVLDAVAKAGYRAVLRNNILECLDKYTGDNSLLQNYKSHLKTQETETLSFRTLPIQKWSWMAWEGFYKELETRIQIDNWDYVPNPSGGFLGAWWHFTKCRNKFASGEMYLQFEQGDLCFKVCTNNRDCRSQFRNECYSRLMEIAKGQFPEIRKPARFGAGEYMTIAKVCPEEFFGEEVVDIKSTIRRLKRYERLIDECCEE